MRRWIVACALAVSLSRAAHADDDDRKPREPRAVWYGWQNLLVDASLIGIASATTLSPQGNINATVFVLDMLAFWIASPMIHQLHDRPTGHSIALHVLAPLLGSFVGLIAGGSQEPPCTGFCFFPSLDKAFTGATYGLLAGAGLAAVVDATALAWGPADHRQTSARLHWSIAPTISSRASGLTVGRAF